MTWTEPSLIRRKKRRLSLVLAGVMTAALLTGCGGSAGADAGSTDGAAQESADAAGETADETARLEETEGENYEELKNQG